MRTAIPLFVALLGLLYGGSAQAQLRTRVDVIVRDSRGIMSDSVGFISAGREVRVEKCELRWCEIFYALHHGFVLESQLEEVQAGKVVQRTVSSTTPSSSQSTETVLTRHCRTEWPGDAEMYEYCVRQQREGIAEKAVLVRTNGGIPTSPFGIALAGCEAEWPQDFQMQVYCLKQQIEGYEEVARGPTSGLASPTSGERSQIQRFCTKEWPDDFQMRAYCEKQQLEGLAYLKTSNSSRKSQCRREWPTDFSMQAYCVKGGTQEPE